MARTSFAATVMNMALARMGISSAAGQFRRLEGMSLITDPIVNSYKRLIPGYLAPVAVGWSFTNDSPLIRLTSIGGDGARIVLVQRSPDGASNPYLVIAACLAAGLQGIREGLVPPRSMEESEGENNPQGNLPRTLHEAVKQFEQDELLNSVLESHIKNHMIHTKEASGIVLQAGNTLGKKERNLWERYKHS